VTESCSQVSPEQGSFAMDMRVGLRGPGEKRVGRGVERPQAHMGMRCLVLGFRLVVVRFLKRAAPYIEVKRVE
jgi:hypothetical protein